MESMAIVIFVAFLVVLAAAVILAIDALRGEPSDPLDSEEIASLTAELLKQPRDEAVKARIRALDLDLRGAFFRRQARAASGRWLLLAGAATLLVCLKLAAYLGERRPAPRQLEGGQERDLRAAAAARWSVAAAGAGVGVAVLALGLALGGPADYSPAPAVAAEPVAHPSAEEMARQWPRFRGPGGLGIAAHANPPVFWNGATGEGILWKTEVPLPGASSPVVWERSVFLTGGNAEASEVYRFDADTGELRWRSPVRAAARGARGAAGAWDAGTHAAATPCTDGRRVVAWFASGEMTCLDLDGAEVWTRSFGPVANTYGHASSLVMHRGMVLAQLDQDEADDGSPRSRLMALDAASGRTVWEAVRPVCDSWSTPIVIEAGSGELVVTTANPFVIAYDAASGTEAWRVEGLAGDVVPSAVCADGLVFAAMETSGVMAIGLDGRIAWRDQGDLPSIPSPLCFGGMLYMVPSNRMLGCRDAADGPVLWQKDLGMSVESSPLAASDRIYVFGETGVCIIARMSAEYEEVARPALGERCRASPAVAGGRLYVRGEKHLFCIGER